MQIVELPGWFYQFIFPTIGVGVGWLFGWDLTRRASTLKSIFKRKN